MDLVSSPLSLESLTSFYIAKMIWDKAIKAKRLQLCQLQQDRYRIWEIHLTVYRDEAIRIVNVFIENYKLTLPLKNILTESVFSLHQAYIELKLWKLNYDQDNKIDIMQDGEFYAPNFFSANGKFNDYLYTKRLMQNENYPIAFRFSLASVYHFEDDVSMLWEELSQLEDIPDEDGFNIFGVCQNFRTFKTTFLQLSAYFQPTEGPERHDAIFDSKIFFLLALNGYEYAVYARWNNMSDSQQLILMSSDRYFEVINGEMDFPKCNVSYFLYSRLLEDRKKDFFQWSMQSDTSEMWLTLLFTSRGGELYFEILEYIYKLPITIFSKLLELLTFRLKQLRLPLDADLFETLWNKVSLEKHKFTILVNCKLIIENLVKAKSFHNIGCIIKSFSVAYKNKLLFGSYGAGINILDILCKEGEFDMLQKYLSFFIDDVKSRNVLYNLRRKYSFPLKEFCESFKFQAWFTNKLSKQQQMEVMSRIDALKRSLYEHLNDCKEKRRKLESSTRISIFEKHFEVKGNSKLIDSFASSQKRNIGKEMKSTIVKRRRVFL